MPYFVLKARVKAGRREALDASLADGSLVDGTARPDALLDALQAGRDAGDTWYVMIEGPDAGLADERRALEPFFDVLNVVEVGEARDADDEDD